MSLEEKVNGNNKKGKGMLKALGGLGLLLHSAFHLVPLLGFGYLTLGSKEGSSVGHSHGAEEGIGHYLVDLMGVGFAIWGIYYAYQGIKEYFSHRKHGHNGYHPEYSH